MDGGRWLQMGFLRTIITGGELCGKRLGQMFPDLYPGGVCTFCSTASNPVVETITHIWWKCPTWEAIRCKHSISRLRAAFVAGKLPNCDSHCGIIPVGFNAIPYLDVDRPSDPAVPRAGRRPKPKPKPKPAPAAAPPTYSERLGPSVPTTDDARDARGEVQRDGRTIVFTDGAATNNQDERFRRAGYGAYWGPAHPLNIGALLKGSNQGNNAAELQAVIAALLADPRPLEIRTDSDHVYTGANRDRHRWRENDWRPKKLATAEICNVDRWRQLDEIIQDRGEGRDLIVWVKGHTRQEQVESREVTPFNHHGNNAADLLATTGAALHAVADADIRAAAARVELAIRLQRLMLQVCQARAEALKKKNLLTEGQADDAAPGMSISQRIQSSRAAAGPAPNVMVAARIDLYPWQWSPPPPHQHGPLILKPALRNRTVTRRVPWASRPQALRPINTEFSFAFGATMWKAFTWWVERLRWPAPSQSRASEGISWIELVIDFETATGIDTPPISGDLESHKTTLKNFVGPPSATYKKYCPEYRDSYT
eukprot:gene57691-biopygen85628